MAEEKGKEEILTEEEQDKETLVNISAEYTDVELDRGLNRKKDKVKTRIYRPKMGDRSMASRFAKAQFLECIAAGVPTRSQAISAARGAGLWTEEMETQMTTIGEKIDQHVQDQAKTENKATKAKHRDKIRKLKQEQLELAGSFTEITRNTVEQIQEDAEQSYLIVKSVFVLEDGDKEVPLYSSVEDMNQERDMSFMTALVNSASAFWLGDSVADFFSLGELLEELQEEGT